MNGRKKQYGVAIIGCGDRGTAHARAWAALDKVCIRTVRDPDRLRAEKLAEQYGAEIADSHREAIDRDDVDIVSVCTPACFHPKHMICGADSGKHTLCEKPMALSLAEGKEMMAAATRNGVKLTFSFQNQYSGVTHRLREIMDTGEIGRPVMARIVSSAEIRPKLAMMSKTGNCGPVVDACCHAFRLWRYMFRSEPVRVQAAGLTISKDADVLKDIDEVALDTATFTVTFASGDIGAYSTCWGLPRGTTSSSYQDILGPKGLIKPAGNSLTVVKGNEDTVLADLQRGGDSAQTAAFLTCIEDDTTPCNTARDAYISLQISLAVLESAATGEAVAIEV